MLNRYGGVCVKKKYFSVTLEIHEFEEELFIAFKNYAVEDYMAIAIQEYDLDEQTIDGVLGTKSYSGGSIDDSSIELIETSVVPNKLKFYFDDENRCQDFADFLEENKNDSEFIKLITIQEEEDFDWVSSWKENYVPIELKTLVVVPEWYRIEETKDEFKKTHKVFPAEKTRLYIHPGMAFGTGGHETTKLCLEAFENIIPQLKNNIGPDLLQCLDFGCGSGILGIASLQNLRDLLVVLLILKKMLSIILV